MLRICCARRLAGASFFVLLAACTGGPGAPGTQQNPHRNQAPSGLSGSGVIDDDDDGQPQIPTPPPASSRIDIGTYKADCAEDSDCVAVYQGELCGGASTCANAAIHREAQVQYQLDRVQKSIACAASGNSGNMAEAAPCQERAARCDQGSKRCAL